MRIAAVLFVGVLIAGCATPVPTPEPVTPAPSAPQPSPPPTPPSPTAATLLVQATATMCGWGCAFTAELFGPGGPWHSDLEPGRGGGALLSSDGFPEALKAGDYTLVMTAWLVSDVFPADIAERTPVVTCLAPFSVKKGQPAVTALGIFGFRSSEPGTSPPRSGYTCSVEVRPSTAAVSIDDETGS